MCVYVFFMHNMLAGLSCLKPLSTRGKKGTETLFPFFVGILMENWRCQGITQLVARRYQV